MPNIPPKFPANLMSLFRRVSSGMSTIPDSITQIRDRAFEVNGWQHNQPNVREGDSPANSLLPVAVTTSLASDPLLASDGLGR